MKTKKLEDLLNLEEFEKLLGYLLLFDKDSEYFIYSGWVTAALLDWEEDNGVPISILALNTQRGLMTFKRTREDLKNMFSKCIEFVGKDEDSSFVLEH